MMMTSTHVKHTLEVEKLNKHVNLDECKDDVVDKI